MNSTKRHYINNFIDEYCELQNVDRDILFSSRRDRSLVERRMVLAFFLRNRTELTWQAIGKIMNKNHASIIHYIKLTEAFIDVYPHIKKIYITAEEAYELYKQKLCVSYEMPETLAEKENSLIEILLNNNQELVRKINKLERKLYDYEN